MVVPTGLPHRPGCEDEGETIDTRIVTDENLNSIHLALGESYIKSKIQGAKESMLCQRPH